MKKKKILLALCALTLCSTLTACSTDTSVSFAFRWNPQLNNEALPLNGKDYYERFEYSVALKKESGSNADYSVEYPTGKYTVTLKKDPDSDNGYILESSFNVSVQYTCGSEQSEIFSDSIVSEVKFKANSSLSPVSSKQTIVTTTPVTLTATSLAECYRRYSYTTETIYDENGSGATFTQTDNGDGNVRNVTKKFSIPSKRSYLDNEQLFFALRGISGTESQDLSVFDASSKQIRTVNVRQDDEDTAEFSFSLKGVEGTHAVTYVPFDVSFSGKNSGATKTLWIAKEQTDNKWRNLILQMETPLSYNLGTLVYTLEKAELF